MPFLLSPWLVLSPNAHFRLQPCSQARIWQHFLLIQTELQMLLTPEEFACKYYFSLMKRFNSFLLKKKRQESNSEIGGQDSRWRVNSRQRMTGLKSVGLKEQICKHMHWWAKCMFREPKWLFQDCVLGWTLGNSLGQKSCWEESTTYGNKPPHATGIWKRRGDLRNAINLEQPRVQNLAQPPLLQTQPISLLFTTAKCNTVPGLESKDFNLQNSTGICIFT